MFVNIIHLIWIAALLNPIGLAEEPNTKVVARQPGPVTTAPAMVSERPKAPEPVMLKVFRLQHADPQDVARTVQSTLDVRAASDPATKSLVVSGPQRLFPSVEDVVTMMDVPPAEPQKTVVLSVPEWVSESALQGLNIVSRRGVQILTGEEEDYVVMSGPAAAVDEANRLFNELVATQRQAPAEWESVQAEFYFLKAQVAGAEGAEAKAKVPQMLEPVVAALAESGIQVPVLVAPITGRFARGREFSQQGTLCQGEDTQKISLSGRAGSGPAEATVSLAIEAEIVGYLAAAGVRNMATTLFKLESELIVKSGDFVVLASAPMNTGDGEDIIVLVVRLTTMN